MKLYFMERQTQAEMGALDRFLTWERGKSRETSSVKWVRGQYCKYWKLSENLTEKVIFQKKTFILQSQKNGNSDTETTAWPQTSYVFYLNAVKLDYENLASS